MLDVSDKNNYKWVTDFTTVPAPTPTNPTPTNPSSTYLGVVIGGIIFGFVLGAVVVITFIICKVKKERDEAATPLIDN